MKCWLSALLLWVCVVATACESRRRENVYKPGGKFVQRLDARGRRHLLQDGDGALLGKIRVRGDVLRVYDAERTSLGDVDRTALTVRRLHDEPVAIAEVDGAHELAGSFRIEPVDRGWAVFDAKARRIGYFAAGDDGRLALRDDYTSAPRVFAEPGVAKTSSGQVLVRATPSIDGELLLPFAVSSDALDPLARVALGAWLQAQQQP